MSETICPHCGGTNTSPTKTGVAFLEDGIRTFQKMIGMKCKDCLLKYKELGDTSRMLKYGIFDIRGVDIVVKETREEE